MNSSKAGKTVAGRGSLLVYAPVAPVQPAVLTPLRRERFGGRQMRGVRMPNKWLVSFRKAPASTSRVLASSSPAIGAAREQVKVNSTSIDDFVGGSEKRRRHIDA
jgi:hypothetical protein